MREYSQLTDEDRIEIYAMKQAGKHQTGDGFSDGDGALCAGQRSGLGGQQPDSSGATASPSGNGVPGNCAAGRRTSDQGRPHAAHSGASASALHPSGTAGDHGVEGCAKFIFDTDRLSLSGGSADYRLIDRKSVV